MLFWSCPRRGEGVYPRANTWLRYTPPFPVKWPRTRDWGIPALPWVVDLIEINIDIRKDQMTYFQDDEERFNSFLLDIIRLTYYVTTGLWSSRSDTRGHMESIMGIDYAGNSSKTVDFLIFCIGNLSVGTTQDGDVTTTGTITETTASNSTTQGKRHAYMNITWNNILVNLLFLK